MKKRILFVCIENSCRSQMAEGFAKKTGGEDFEIFSAGSKPLGKLDPTAIVVMKEKGIDISDQKSKGFFDLPYKAFDYVITMGAKTFARFIRGKKPLIGKLKTLRVKSYPTIDR